MKRASTLSFLASEALMTLSFLASEAQLQHQSLEQRDATRSTSQLMDESCVGDVAARSG